MPLIDLRELQPNALVPDSHPMTRSLRAPLTSPITAI